MNIADYDKCANASPYGEKWKREVFDIQAENAHTAAAEFKKIPKAMGTRLRHSDLADVEQQSDQQYDSSHRLGSQNIIVDFSRTKT